MRIHNHDQGTPEWFAARSGMPTASAAAKMVTPKGLKISTQHVKYAALLAAELHKGEGLADFTGSKHTERGHELEPIAADYYAFEYETPLKQVGFITDDAGTHGASLDRLFEDNTGAVELKCINAGDHMIAMDSVDKGACPIDHILQINMQMMVAEVDFVDLYYYHPDLPSVRYRLHKDYKVQAALQSAITQTIAERDRFYKLILKNMG